MVLLIVAMATTIAAFMAQQQGFWQREMENGRDQAQARRIAEAGIDWARAVLADDASVNQYDNGKEMWAMQLPAIPVEGGEVQGTIVDQQGLFNLNNLVSNGVVNAPALARYQRLLTALNLPQELGDTLVDWMDANSETMPNGAEDEYYLNLAKPYRCANRPLSDIGELAWVKGYDATIIRRLLPFVSVLPEMNTGGECEFRAAGSAGGGTAGIDVGGCATDGDADQIDPVQNHGGIFATIAQERVTGQHHDTQRQQPIFYGDRTRHPGRRRFVGACPAASQRHLGHTSQKEPAMNLRIYLTAHWQDAASVCAWALLDDAGNVRESGNGTLASMPQSDNAIVIVAAESVLATTAVLPKIKRSKLETALPFALEDALIDDATEAHVTTGAKLPDGRTVLYTLNKSWLARFLAASTTSRMRVRRVVPEFCLLPTRASEWSVAWDGAQGFLATAAQSGRRAGQRRRCARTGRPAVAFAERCTCRVAPVCARQRSAGAELGHQGSRDLRTAKFRLAQGAGSRRCAQPAVGEIRAAAAHQRSLALAASGTDGGTAAVWRGSSRQQSGMGGTRP